MINHWCGDDEQLIAELGEAVRTAREVPARFIDVGKAVFSWRNLDAELAELTYDSAADSATALAGTRAEAATLRALTFVAGRLTIEIEVTPDALLGQVLPPEPGEIELSGRDGSTRTVPVDEVGWFAIRPTPSGSLRLRLRTANGGSVLTQWFTL